MNEKRLAGEKAAEYIRDGMIVGLGTGSTAAYAIRRIGAMVKQGLTIRAVSTSSATTAFATSLGIPLIPIDEVERVDLTIDGADEIDGKHNAIKGGGGALLREKIVALASDRVIWVVDSTKIVEKLGRTKLPAEVIPFGVTHLRRFLVGEGLAPVLRKDRNGPFVTDSGNYILDLRPASIEDPQGLGAWLKSLAGVVEHGLFINLADTIIVGRGDSVDVIQCRRNRLGF